MADTSFQYDYLLVSSNVEERCIAQSVSRMDTVCTKDLLVFSLATLSWPIDQLKKQTRV